MFKVKVKDLKLFFEWLRKQALGFVVSLETTLSKAPQYLKQYFADIVAYFL
jgi:hypothetical protein